MRRFSTTWMLRGVWLWLLIGSSAWALDATPTAADPALEVRVMALAGELRCLVCQNQSLADSHADLAIDLKNQVREQLRAGRTDEQVIDYMTERYGDFVLYRPPFKRTTLLLWVGPLLLVLGGGLVLWRALRTHAVGPQRGGNEPVDAAHLLHLLEPRESAGMNARDAPVPNATVASIKHGE